MSVKIVLPKRIRPMQALSFCFVLWVALVSLALLLFGQTPYLSGFLLGAAGSAAYMFLLYRRIPAMLQWPFILKYPRRDRPDSRPAVTVTLESLRAGWFKTLQPIVAIALVILAFSRVFPSISFLAALFGFFSFQISLFLYVVLILIFDMIQVTE